MTSPHPLQGPWSALQAPAAAGKPGVGTAPTTSLPRGPSHGHAWDQPSDLERLGKTVPGKLDLSADLLWALMAWAFPESSSSCLQGLKPPNPASGPCLKVPVEEWWVARGHRHPLRQFSLAHTNFSNSALLQLTSLVCALVMLVGSELWTCPIRCTSFLWS